METYTITVDKLATGGKLITISPGGKLFVPEVLVADLIDLLKVDDTSVRSWQPLAEFVAEHPDMGWVTARR